jgi:hypothetical protein
MDIVDLSKDSRQQQGNRVVILTAGDTAAEMEAQALRAAAEFFGPDSGDLTCLPWQARPDTSISAEAKYMAGIAVEQAPAGGGEVVDAEIMADPDLVQQVIAEAIAENEEINFSLPEGVPRRPLPLAIFRALRRNHMLTGLGGGGAAAEFVIGVAEMATDAERVAEHPEDAEAREEDTGTLDSLIGRARAIVAASSGVRFAAPGRGDDEAAAAMGGEG